MNNQKQLTIEDYKLELEFLSLKYAKVMQSLSNQVDYSMQLEVENEYLQKKLNQLSAKPQD